MNSRRRRAIFIGLLLVAAMLLYPPWRSGQRSIGYHLFFRQAPAGVNNAYLDWSRLGLQCLIVGVLVAAVIALLNGKKQD